MQSNALVVEDQDLMRQVLMAELKSVLKDGAVHAAGTLDGALALSREHDFDLVLIDPGLPGVRPTSKLGRLTVVEEIIDSLPQALHIVITGSDSKAEALACQKLGANAYVSKVGLDRNRLRKIISELPETDFYVSYSEVRSLAPEFLYQGLTAREQAIIDFMFQEQRGMKRREAYAAIGARFGITTDSAEKYFKRARAKLIRRGLFPAGN